MDKGYENGSIIYFWSEAGLFVLLFKEYPRGSRSKRQGASLVCYSNVLATVRIHSLVYHEFKTDPNIWEMPK